MFYIGYQTKQSKAGWNPKVYAENLVGLPRQMKVETNKVVEGNVTFLVEKRSFSGTFATNMMVRNFPFDIQVISY